MKPTDLAPAPFSHPISVDSLSAARPTPFDLVADADGRAEIAAFLDLPTLDEMRFKGDIAAHSKGRWRLNARLTARFTQRCVISLSEVGANIDETVVREFIPAAEMVEMDAEDLEFDPDQDDDPDPFEGSIDPGMVAVECLALALDSYPRAPGAEISISAVTEPGLTPLTDEDLKPFAGLASLKEKMTRGG